jgi:hypothetical protein
MRPEACALTILIALFAPALLLPAALAAGGAPLVAGWEPADDPSILSGGNATFSVNLTSPACTTLSFQWFVDGALVPGEKGPSFGFRAGTELSGAVNISVAVSDGNATERHAWTLIVESPLRPVPEGPVSLPEGGSQTFRVLGPGWRNLTWFLDGADTGKNGTDFVYAPDFRSAGAHTISVSAEGSTVRSWNVTVTEVNRPPALPPGRLLRAVAGEAVTVRVNASDPDGGPLRYRWDLDSDGVPETDSNSTGNLSTSFPRAGVFRATLNVTDEAGASASAVYVFEVQERPALPAWALPAALAGLAALALAALAAVQARRLSKLREARARAGFFATRERPPAAGKEPPAAVEEAPGTALAPDDEPELLQVRSQLPAKKAELEASAELIQPDMPLSKRFAPAGPSARSAPGEPEKAGPGAAGGALRDKGAESETGAEETDVGRRGFAPKKK